MVAWREHTASSVGALWRLHQSTVASQQQRAVGALSALWRHAAARRQQQACQLRAARYVLRGTGSYFVAWRLAARQRAAVQRVAQRSGAAAWGGRRALEARVLRTWRGVCDAAVQVRALTNLVLRGGAGRGLRTWRAAAAERSERLGAARRCAVDIVHREVAAALRSWREVSAARSGALRLWRRLVCREKVAALGAWGEVAAAAAQQQQLAMRAVMRIRGMATRRALARWVELRDEAAATRAARAAP